MEYFEIIKQYFCNLDEGNKFYWYLGTLIIIAILFLVFNVCNDKSKSSPKK